ncbi:hypothetical protein M011DRAFT_484284 [Sporormia fimetaria CBS 119925]|uniref:Uncharacterized protein n=1 Tax=Sporormia fimetaria CBS 119925 TaxID=1340428 RepID=A0A6A6VK30_9PLEO|nr:hypothetical protein M011DRAFT_484284 [Sporormia fimetaria CBS 119925]
MQQQPTTPPRRHASSRMSSPILNRTVSPDSSKSGRGGLGGLMRRLSSSRSQDMLRQLTGSPIKQREKLDPQLWEALQLLQLQDIYELETRFLNTDAFLQPWAYFRDHFLLLQKNGMPRSSSRGQINRTDILQFYTFFDEGRLRYDPRADESHPRYSHNKRTHGVIDKTAWSVVEHEKMLYVWLLQSFKVGKSSNPYGFEYFEGRNVCTVWQHVLVPIVDAVRNDYNLKGRYHYGRLARFIEDMHPSRMAFPESNMTTLLDARRDISRDTEQVERRRQSSPYRRQSNATTHQVKIDIHPVTGIIRYTTRVVDQEERELRRAFPQYGQVVERPKPRKDFFSWIDEQRQKRAGKHHDKALKFLLGEEPYPDPEVLANAPLPSIEDLMNPPESRKGTSALSKDNFLIKGHPFEEKLTKAREAARNKRASGSSLSPRSSKQSLSPTAPSGSTHHRESSATHVYPYVMPKRDDSGSLALPANMSLPRAILQRKQSDGVYSSIRNSNPFFTDPGTVHGHPAERNSNVLAHDAEPNQESSHPKTTHSHPAEPATGVGPDKAGDHKQTGTDQCAVRMPSYEGTGYASPLPTLQEVNSSEVIGLALTTDKATEDLQARIKSSKSTDKVKATRIPSPIEVPRNELARKYHPVQPVAERKTLGSGELLRSSSGRNYHPIVEKAVELAEKHPAAYIPTPVVPAKNPKRYRSMNGHVRAPAETAKSPDDEGCTPLGHRILSKENIRAALSVDDEELEASTQTSPLYSADFTGIGGRGLNTGESPRVETYNRHMFPRGSGSLKRLNVPGGEYEMKMLGREEEQ